MQITIPKSTVKEYLDRAGCEIQVDVRVGGHVESSVTMRLEETNDLNVMQEIVDAVERVLAKKRE